MNRRFILRSAGAAALMPGALMAQEKYPSKPITWVCPYGAR
jgi:tripartite-type tricarboxylate transporter receptor subunit TctC